MMMMFTEGVDKFGHSLQSKDSETTRGPPGVGFKLSEKGDYSLEQKRLIRVASPEDPEDAVNRAWVEKQIEAVNQRVTENVKNAESIAATEKSHYEFLNQKVDSFQRIFDDNKLQVISDLEFMRKGIEGLKTVIIDGLKDSEARLRTEVQTRAHAEAQSVVGIELKAFAYAIHKKFEAHPSDAAHEANLKKHLNNSKYDWHSILKE